MSDLLRFLEAGRFDLVIIVGLLLALLWAVKQWRAAEADKDKLQDARLDDVRLMVQLATEVKNSVASLVQLIERGGRER